MVRWALPQEYTVFKNAFTCFPKRGINWAPATWSGVGQQQVQSQEPHQHPLSGAATPSWKSSDPLSPEQWRHSKGKDPTSCALQVSGQGSNKAWGPAEGGALQQWNFNWLKWMDWKSFGSGWKGGFILAQMNVAVGKKNKPVSGLNSHQIQTSNSILLTNWLSKVYLYKNQRN